MGDLVMDARNLAESRLSTLPRRLAHVRGVAAAAEQVATSLGLDRADELMAAAWLHDVGYAPSVRTTGFHPLDGAEFLAAEEWPDEVVSLVAFHTGAPVEAEERGLGEPLVRFSRPDADLLDVLTYVDMTIGPDGLPVVAAERVTEILARYAPDDMVHRAVSRSAPGLLRAVGRVEARLGVRRQPK